MSLSTPLALIHHLSQAFLFFAMAGIEEAVRNDLRNQFYFSDRAAQTFNTIVRERGVATEPPATTDHNDTMSNSVAFDAYMEDIAAQKLRVNGENRLGDEELLDMKVWSVSDSLYSESMRVTMKVMERMINQNSENEVYTDFKYWEDKSDAFKDGEGTLLPLWRFTNEHGNRKQVTCLKWNTRYTDLFAVGFGSFDFLKQQTGAICFYSLKNTHFPERTYLTESGVCSLDWHPSSPATLAVGFYDGSVAVYDLRMHDRRPIYQSSSLSAQRHTDAVWQVRWNINDEAMGILSFCSVSTDGQVLEWKLMKSKLESETITELVIDEPGNTNPGLASGLCFDFHPSTEGLYLVGTEEGKVHKALKSHSGNYLATFNAHSMAVYSVKWNKYHPLMFLSASADWFVKVWRQDAMTPVMSFDLGSAVGDVSWAPYSSTVFAAGTADGVMHFYDLAVNRTDRIVYQKVIVS